MPQPITIKTEENESQKSAENVINTNAAQQNSSNKALTDVETAAGSSTKQLPEPDKLSGNIPYETRVSINFISQYFEL